MRKTGDGYLRLIKGRGDNGVEHTRNTLTQRTFGPVRSASTVIEVENLKNGDVAGLIALQKRYGYVGVKIEDGSKSVVMVSTEIEEPIELESIPLEQNKVWLKIDCDFKNRTDKAYF